MMEIFEGAERRTELVLESGEKSLPSMFVIESDPHVIRWLSGGLKAGEMN